MTLEALKRADELDHILLSPTVDHTAIVNLGAS